VLPRYRVAQSDRERSRWAVGRRVGYLSRNIGFCYERSTKCTHTQNQCSELVQWGPSESSELRASPEFFPRSLGTRLIAAWATRGSLGTRAQQEEATRSSLGTRSSLPRCELVLSTMHQDTKPV
jgi:hypothetical protein